MNHKKTERMRGLKDARLDQPGPQIYFPEINQYYNAGLLSTPAPDILLEMFNRGLSEKNEKAD